MYRLYNALQLCLRTSLAVRTVPRLMCSKGQGAKATEPTSLSAAARAHKSLKAAPRITLVSTNQLMSVTSLEEAQKLAKRRDLHLVQIQQMDTKTKRPVYKLVTAAEMLSEEAEDHKSDDKADAEEKEKSTPKKSEKSLTIGSRIAEHDLESRLKNIAKWLSKRHEVRVLIQCSNSDDLQKGEKIVKAIEQSIKTPEATGRIVQKRAKGSVIKFSILPLAPMAASPPVPA